VRTLRLASDVAATLAGQSIPTAVIGAVAAAAHGYPRSTEDLDLATFAEPSALAKVAQLLAVGGRSAEFVFPDAEDPLGGVINVEEAGADLVQVVNFYNPLGRGSGTLASEAIEEADIEIGPGSGLRAVRLPHLIALKLYGGGPDSHRDIRQLLARNPDANLGEIRAVCERHGLAPDLARLLAAHDG
jgi:hypothetical protein